MELTEDARIKVYVQLVAAHVTEPTNSYMALMSNRVNIVTPRLEHAILPNGDRIPIEPHFTHHYLGTHMIMPSTRVGRAARNSCWLWGHNHMLHGNYKSRCGM